MDAFLHVEFGIYVKMKNDVDLIMVCLYVFFVSEKNISRKFVDGTLYKQIVGSLGFLCNSRPNICFEVGLVSRFMSDPRVSHMVATKRTIRYLKGTQKYGLLFPNRKGDKVDKKNTSSYLFPFLSWCSKKKSVVALSSCEAEYIASSQATCQILWLESLLEELKIEYKKPIQLFVNKKSPISLAKNPIAHGRNKHIETKFHFLRDQVSKEKLKLVYCCTELQVANVFTKPLKAERFKKLMEMLGVVSLEHLNN
uniref:Copia protein n=1 Tax=Cajanus cajan TaxID=3821 RepID=A0A151T9D5_CAJCA|nr:Copia protein [Cajanus cajan]